GGLVRGRVAGERPGEEGGQGGGEQAGAGGRRGATDLKGEHVPRSLLSGGLSSEGNQPRRRGEAAPSTPRSRQSVRPRRNPFARTPADRGGGLPPAAGAPA